jgi:hypothetical protein
MAMTWTVQQDGDDVWGKERFRYMKGVAASADYPTGGYPYTPATFGLTVITNVELISGPLGWATQIDTVNNKVIVFGGSAAAAGVASQAAAATDFSTTQGFILRVFGR